MPRRVRWLMVVGLTVGTAVIAGAVLAHQAPESSHPHRSSAGDPLSSRSPSAPSPPLSLPRRPSGAGPSTAPGSEHRDASPGDARGDGRGDGPSQADGAVPDGVTVFDDAIPAVANLDPGLLKALRRAAKDAAAEGVEFQVNSGWRSPEYQERLLREAVSTYGSEEEAARWVATPATSPHVSGEAVDIGGADATAWLAGHGAAYGLCPIYRNEPWHYELRAYAIDRGCPGMYADPTRDPRMRR
ncbi:M15 family metallopeptidase [Streptomyces sp. NA04227]|uniref:M15 family metallopeptidase n=1 Tax=Streptomyces sp. NA04227 TaxID=2742136 RepID=UPI0015915DA7|nr:M15 family metallopeptidase [Streptomyces sp. NA04227]QKW08821.1 M15 family metallopeptidase [Streptomyces sp. NA04227]